MNLNATIIVQMINFFITFWIVRFLLIRPVMAALCADQKVVNDLQNTRDHAQQYCTEMQVQRERMWQNAQAVFEHEVPAPHTTADSIFKDIAPSITYTVLSQEDQDAFVIQSAQKVVKRLERFSE